MGPKVYRSRLGAVGQIGNCGGAKAVAVALFAVNRRGRCDFDEETIRNLLSNDKTGTEYRIQDTR